MALVARGLATPLALLVLYKHMIYAWTPGHICSGSAHEADEVHLRGID